MAAIDAEKWLEEINFIKQSFLEPPMLAICAASAFLSESEDAISPIIGDFDIGNYGFNYWNYACLGYSSNPRK